MRLAALSLTALVALNAAPTPRAVAADNPVVVLDTSMGAITIELDAEKAPISTANFLKYVDAGFYDGLVFHRVISASSPKMIQGGGMKDEGGALREMRAGAFPPIKNESGNGLSNVRGTIAMARTRAVNSATSQFFINHQDNLFLDNGGGGYAVFGKVTGGMDVVDAIAKVETGQRGPHGDVPVTPVVIKSAKRKP